GGSGGRGRGGGGGLCRLRGDRRGRWSRRRFARGGGRGLGRRRSRIALGRRQQGRDVDLVPGGGRRDEVGQRRQVRQRRRLVRFRSLSGDRFDAQVAVALDEVEDLAHRRLVRRGVEPDRPDQLVFFRV